MTARERRYRQAAWTYLVYGVLYWLGGVALIQAGLGPQGMTRRGVTWFVLGALFIVVIPWLLSREHAWFDRWILSRRDFTRILAFLVAIRAAGVGRAAWTPTDEVVPILGVAVSMRLGAGAFFAATVLVAIVLARAAWSRS